MSIIKYKSPRFDNIRCPICGQPLEWGMHKRSCELHCSLICGEHCDTCEYYNNAASIALCSYIPEIPEEYLEGVAQEKGICIKGIRFWYVSELAEYAVYFPWGEDGGEYQIWSEEDVLLAWGAYIARLDKRITYIIDQSRGRKDPPDIDIALPSRGLSLTRQQDGVYEIVSRAYEYHGYEGGWGPEYTVNKEYQGEPHDAWEYFRTRLDAQMRHDIGRKYPELRKKYGA